MRAISGFTDYELIDCSAGEKLERWGDVLLIRPDPQILWNTPREDPRWQTAHARYHRSSSGGGHWETYRAVRPNRDTLALFCHLGVECVLLAHLIGASPMVLWHGTCMAPSSVTSVYTEERRPGIAFFRAAALGDTSHLYAKGAEPSFAARFCEVYGNGDRID